MNFLELAERRYSVRDFSDKPISDENLAMILEAGRLAPTAKNSQSQVIYVITGKENLEKIRSVTKMVYNAPVVLLIGHDTNKSFTAEAFGEDFDMGSQDADIVATFMMLEATDLGIGSLWARGFNAKEVHQALHLPDNFVLDLILDLGYPSENAKPSERHFDREPLKETVKILNLS